TGRGPQSPAQARAGVRSPGSGSARWAGASCGARRAPVGVETGDTRWPVRHRLRDRGGVVMEAYETEEVRRGVEMNRRDPAELSPTRLARLCGRALKLRCPQCGGRGLLKTWLRLREHCPTCGLKLDRGETDHFIGGY